MDHIDDVSHEFIYAFIISSSSARRFKMVFKIALVSVLQ